MYHVGKSKFVSPRGHPCAAPRRSAPPSGTARRHRRRCGAVRCLFKERARGRHSRAAKLEADFPATPRLRRLAPHRLACAANTHVKSCDLFFNFALKFRLTDLLKRTILKAVADQRKFARPALQPPSPHPPHLLATPYLIGRIFPSFRKIFCRQRKRTIQHAILYRMSLYLRNASSCRERV